jgi:hypothetical protein
VVRVVVRIVVRVVVRVVVSVQSDFMHLGINIKALEKLVSKLLIQI